MAPFLRKKPGVLVLIVLLALVVWRAVVVYAQTNVANPASDLTGQWVVTRAQNQTISGTYTWTVPVRFATGTAGSPGVVSADTTTGWQLGSGLIGGSISGVQRFLLNATSGLTIFGTNIVNTSGVLQFPYIVDCGRLTLTSGTATTTADVLAATTLYLTPIPDCNSLTQWDGTNSVIKQTTLTEISIAVPATTSQMYDVFTYDNAGTNTLELLAWTNDTTRATALTVQNGFLAKSATPTRRYVGSFRTTGVSGQTEDSAAKRYVWNYYNRAERPCQAALETADNWTYTTATFRQANNNAANQIDVVIGYADNPITVDLFAIVVPSTGIPTIAIGEDSTTVVASNQLQTVDYSNGFYTDLIAKLRKVPTVGRHYYAWLEYSTASGTTTWYGDDGRPGKAQAGIMGTIRG